MANTDAGFLAALNDADRQKLFLEGVRRTWNPGEHLCREGDAGAAIMIVIDGYVKLDEDRDQLDAKRCSSCRGPGAVLGEMSVVDGGPQSANAIALGRVDALSIPASRFDALRRERASIANALLEVTVARLRQASARQLELGTVDVIGRVCRRLSELARTHGETTPEGVLVRALSQQELADWAGVSRDGVVRAMTELRREQLVESGRGRFLIRDLAAVTQRAGAGSSPEA